MSNTHRTRTSTQYDFAVRNHALTVWIRKDRDKMMREARLSKADVKKLYPDGRTRKD